MQFYKIRIALDTKDEDLNQEVQPRRARNRASRELGSNLTRLCENYSDEIVDNGFFFLSNIAPDNGYFGLILRDLMDVEKFVHSFAKETKLDVISEEIKEITFYDFSNMLQEAERNGYIYDDFEVLREYGIEELAGRHFGSMYFEEKTIKARDKETIYKSANTYFTKDTLIPELDRIFVTPVGKKAYGHPVNYIIKTDDDSTKIGATQLLIQALLNVGRIKNRRFCELEFEPNTSISKSRLNALFRSCSGGVVVLDFNNDKSDEDDLANGDYEYMEYVCKVIRSHCCTVLPIFRLPRECKNLQKMIYENMGNCTFVEINEEYAIGENAISYLKGRAKEYHIRYDNSLLSSFDKEKTYLISELNTMFDEWYSRKLKTTVFSQYKNIATVKAEVRTKKPEGKAYDELESMIGLSSAKEVIHQALDSYKAQKIFKEKGMAIDTFCNHMIFTGNPGTAKTTVARLFAKILRDNEVLSRGHIVEVGRGDLVGKFVGWTANIVKQKFTRAKGGILFIDEAYSLVDDRNGSFGDEAINTIVQEMENHRDDVIVIFAGYPDKMEEFLDKNPGLRSRIAHYIHFEDYSSDELCQIASHIASKSGLVLDDGAIENLKGIMENAKNQSDFGNGRFVRNIIERAQMAQRSRLVHLDYDSVTCKDIKTICAEDVKAPAINTGKMERHIGFAV